MIEHAEGATMLARFVYELDANGNRTKVTLMGGGEETYVLDELNSVTYAEYANGDEVDFEFDAGGNRVQMTVTPSGGSPITAGYTYDDADQLTNDGSIAYTHDDNGNMTAAGSDSFAWTWDNKLASATVGSTTTENEYAADGTRSAKTEGSTTTPYLWDRLAGLPLLLNDGDDASPHAGGLLAAIDGSDDTTYTLRDGIGSGRDIASGAPPTACCLAKAPAPPPSSPAR